MRKERNPTPCCLKDVFQISTRPLLHQEVGPPPRSWDVSTPERDGSRDPKVEFPDTGGKTGEGGDTFCVPEDRVRSYTNEHTEVRDTVHRPSIHSSPGRSAPTSGRKEYNFQSDLIPGPSRHGRTPGNIYDGLESRPALPGRHDPLDKTENQRLKRFTKGCPVKQLPSVCGDSTCIRRNFISGLLALGSAPHGLQCVPS